MRTHGCPEDQRVTSAFVCAPICWGSRSTNMRVVSDACSHLLASLMEENQMFSDACCSSHLPGSLIKENVFSDVYSHLLGSIIMENVWFLCMFPFARFCFSREMHIFWCVPPFAGVTSICLGRRRWSFLQLQVRCSPHTPNVRLLFETKRSCVTAMSRGMCRLCEWLLGTSGGNGMKCL